MSRKNVLHGNYIRWDVENKILKRKHGMPYAIFAYENKGYWYLELKKLIMVQPAVRDDYCIMKQNGSLHQNFDADGTVDCF